MSLVFARPALTKVSAGLTLEENPPREFLDFSNLSCYPFQNAPKWRRVSGSTVSLVAHLRHPGKASEFAGQSAPVV
ncbi:MAG: hypothetical protein IPL47_04730 [Phyllobacteriaceae bacterium]|nr:hypothetical protein [Phyllobacteriaceae bacterium]